MVEQAINTSSHPHIVHEADTQDVDKGQEFILSDAQKIFLQKTVIQRHVNLDTSALHHAREKLAELKQGSSEYKTNEAYVSILENKLILYRLYSELVNRGTLLPMKDFLIDELAFHFDNYKTYKRDLDALSLPSKNANDVERTKYSTAVNMSSGHKRKSDNLREILGIMHVEIPQDHDLLIRADRIAHENLPPRQPKHKSIIGRVSRILPHGRK